MWTDARKSSGGANIDPNLRRIVMITTESEYLSVLAQIAELMDREPELGTPDGERLDMLVDLVEEYEHIHYPIDPPNPEDTTC